jgi:hypothetical protein
VGLRSRYAALSSAARHPSLTRAQTAQIGYGLAIAGASAAAIQLLAMPYLLRALDAGTLYALTLAAWPAAFGVLPAAHWLSESGYSGVAVWTLIATSLCLSRLGCMAYSAHMILVKDAAPTKAALGRTNGLAQVFHTSARALAPSLVRCAHLSSTRLRHHTDARPVRYSPCPPHRVVSRATHGPPRWSRSAASRAAARAPS